MNEPEGNFPAAFHDDMTAPIMLKIQYYGVLPVTASSCDGVVQSGRQFTESPLNVRTKIALPATCRQA